jgi:putative ABC transport system ATP-binding protein
MGAQEIHALEGLELQVRQGEFLALMGPSGSGKSTALNLIGGLDRPTEGEIWIDGQLLGQGGERELTLHRRRVVGFVFQAFNLLSTHDALENVAMPLVFADIPRHERGARAQTLLAQMGLRHRLRHRPAELSAGEQQRVAIARALVHEPEILLADEPTGNLDTATGGEIMEILAQLNRERGLTILVVTHDPEVARYAERTVHLRDGRIERIESRERTT